MATAVTLAAMPLGGCSREAAASHAAHFAALLRDRVTIDAMMGHLAMLQQIADTHGGNRALGTPGYDASVDYVAGTLRQRGFEVTTPEFEVQVPFADDPELSVDGTKVPAQPLQFATGTAAAGVTGPLVAARVEGTPGCTATDYDGLPVAGAVVLVDRGGCEFRAKQAAAAERGAVALIVANNAEGEMGGSLGAQTGIDLPVVSVGKGDGAWLRAEPGPITIKLAAGVRTEKSRNVIAQTKTGSPSDVIMLGAHLDSVPWGPGINDNASGVAAVLETAVQLGSSPEVNNAVRLGFWGAEEFGLRGSRHYVGTLDEEELKDIALYLNFDVLASPNPGYFTYNGERSVLPDRNGQRTSKAQGSAGIERALSEYLTSAGATPQGIETEGRSDDGPFDLAGVPTGGLFSGADKVKSDEQARLWGGKTGEPFDPNYHTSTDTLVNLNRRAMHINGGGVAYAAGLYAQYLAGHNGVPDRQDRARHPGRCSAAGQNPPASCGCGVGIRNGVASWTCASST